MKNIHPIHDTMLSTERKEALLRQKGIVLWFLGLSGSGKSTLAKGLEKKLYDKGYYSMLLDGDNLRTGLNKNLDFCSDDRQENLRRTSEVAKLFAYNGAITICSFISPTEKSRAMVKEIVGDKYFQVYVNSPLEVCEDRDVKGLYKKARKGEIENFTGIGAPFETPLHSDFEVRTDLNSIEDSINLVYESILQHIKQ